MLGADARVILGRPPEAVLGGEERAEPNAGQTPDHLARMGEVARDGGLMAQEPHVPAAEQGAQARREHVEAGKDAGRHEAL